MSINRLLASDWPLLEVCAVAFSPSAEAGGEGREEEKTEDGRPAWQMMKAFFLCVRRRGGAAAAAKPSVGPSQMLGALPADARPFVSFLRRPFIV